MLMLPSALMIISLIFNKTILMILSFVWLVPYSIYMAVAPIPSIWNLFLGFLLLRFLLNSFPLERVFLLKEKVFQI